MDAADPVMSIVRLFNRAYRLHTPGAIPSGRTDGKVSVSVFNEYEYMGGSSYGSPTQPGGGPYRNIKIFDQWKAGVDSILADTKYRPIFSENTTLSFESSESGSGDPVSAPGKMLLRFINKLNDDNTMYAGGGTEKGSMYKFYEEYFGLVPPKGDDGGAAALQLKKDQDENDKVSKGVIVVNTKWVKLSDSGLNSQDLFEIIKKDKEETKGLSFRFTVTNDKGEDVKYYSCIKDIINTNPIKGEMFFSQQGYAFDMTKCLVPEDKRPKNIYLGEISGAFKVGAPCNIKYINLEKATNVGNDPEPLMKYNIKNIEVLISDDDEKKPYKDFKLVLKRGFDNLNNNVKTAKDILKRPSPK